MYLNTILGNKYNKRVTKESLKCTITPGGFQTDMGHILLLLKMVTFYTVPVNVIILFP